MAFAVASRAQTANLTVDATHAVRTVDQRQFGANAVVWDQATATAQTIALVQAAGLGAVRIPGGGESDVYDWSTNESYQSAGVLAGWTWPAGFDQFAQLITSANLQTFVTVNYGSGTPQQAAAWVAYANASSTLPGTAADVLLGVDTYGVDWKTAGFWSSLRASKPLATDDGRNFLRLGRSSPFGLKYWEVGNECYGTWEYDVQKVQNDPVEYGTRFAQYYALMKAVDPTIRIGAVATTSTEGPYNYPTEAVTDPVTHQQQTDWDHVMLGTMKNAGVMPDYLICHRYEQNAGQENDATLLQLASAPATGWPVDAALLRGPLNDFFGAAAANVELCVTENNSVHNDPGKQMNSLVNGLYMADSLGSLLQTEFNSMVWWDLRNGPNTNSDGTALAGNMSSSLYGWRMYGDYGLLSMPSLLTPETTYYDAYPPYYAMKLLSHFARGGDTIVQAASDNTLLSVYAARRADGSLCLLAVNKSPTSTLSANVSLTGFTPQPAMTVYSYGIPQDEAARTGSGSPNVAVSSQSLPGPAFTLSLSPYSATVLSITPAVAASITTQPQNQAVKTGQAATFTVVAGGSPAPTCQWQCSADGGSTWADLANDSTYSGVKTPTLTVSNAVIGLDGDQYRCAVTNAVDTATSSAAVLSVSLNDQALVQLLYLDVLDRPADVGGLANFVAALAAGQTPSAVLGDLLGSPEYGLRQVEPVIRLYYVALVRPPDYTGLQNWSNALHAGALTLTQAANQFVASPEFQLRYGTLDNMQFVQQLYLNVLGREADTAGLNDWLGQLNDGTSRGAVMVGFSESNEFKQDVANEVEIVRLYFLLLQRMPTAAELQEWTSFLKGYSQTDTLYALGYPPGLSDTDYVQVVFRGLLRRDADAGALGAFGAALAAGTLTHGSLVETVINSDEFNRFVAPVSRLYVGALQRVPDQAGLDNWVNFLRAGASLEDMADVFVANEEFLLRYGALNNQQYVAQLYLNILDREGGADELGYWTGLLNSGGMTRGQVLIGFSESQEAVNLLAPTLRTFLQYFTFLNAAPTQQELDNWKSYLTDPIDQMRAALLTEPEFTSKG